MNPQVSTEYLDYASAARLLGVPIGTLYGLVAQRRIPHVRLGRRLVRFDRRVLERWLADRAIEPLAEPSK